MPSPIRHTPPISLSRRGLLKAGASAGAALALPPSLLNAARAHASPRKSQGVLNLTYGFNRHWRFGGVYRAGSQDAAYPLGGFRHVTLPHTVTRLSWGDWDP